MAHPDFELYSILGREQPTVVKSVTAQLTSNTPASLWTPATGRKFQLMGGALGDVPLGWTTAPRVLVCEKNAVVARALIDAAQSEDDGPLSEDIDVGLPEDAVPEE